MRLLGLALILALGLSGCAPAPRYPASVAAVLERHVLAVANASADGNFSQALATLGELQSAAATAQERGDLTPDRLARIATAIDLVRQDLQGKISAAQQTALDGAISSLTEQQQKLAEQQKQADQRQAELEKKANEAKAAEERAAVSPAPPAPAQPAPGGNSLPKDDKPGNSGDKANKATNGNGKPDKH